MDSNHQVSLSLNQPHLPFCYTRNEMVGAARVERAVSPKEIWGYSPVPPADIDLTPMAESLGIEPSRLLRLTALAVPRLTIRLALGGTRAVIRTLCVSFGR